VSAPGSSPLWARGQGRHKPAPGTTKLPSRHPLARQPAALAAPGQRTGQFSPTPCGPRKSTTSPEGGGVVRGAASAGPAPKKKNSASKTGDISPLPIPATLYGLAPRANRIVKARPRHRPQWRMDLLAAFRAAPSRLIQNLALQQLCQKFVEKYESSVRATNQHPRPQTTCDE
jgi:hypothetical protein